MKIEQITIGLKFNRKMFRIQDMAGTLIDKILADKNINKNINPYFSLISLPIHTNEGDVGFLMKNKSTELTATHSQIIFTKTLNDDNGSLSFDSTAKEFGMILTIFDKAVESVEIRRAGVVFSFDLNGESDSASKCIKILTSFKDVKDQSDAFNLQFDEKYLTDDVKKESRGINLAVDDYINIIKTFSCNRVFGQADLKTSASIDIQRYFNPAKVSSIGAINSLRSPAVENKDRFFEFIKKMEI